MDKIITAVFLVLLAPTHIIGACIGAVCQMIDTFTLGAFSDGCQ